MGTGSTTDLAKPTFVSIVQVFLSLLAIPVVGGIVHTLLQNYQQQNTASQLSDDPENTGFVNWMATNADLITVVAVLLVIALIWLPSVLRYYVKH